MVKRSIEQEIRNKNFGARNGNYEKNAVVKNQGTEQPGATVHFASLMDICHLKNAELEAKHQKYKGRVVLRGDIVKDNSCSYAVFTEQGSSASQMTAAKIMDGQGDGVPEASAEQAAADSPGSGTCVCTNT